MKPRTIERTSKRRTVKPRAASKDIVYRNGDGPAINAKWEWHQRALLALRERLLAERGDNLDQASQSLERYSMDMGDSASDEFTANMALSQVSADQDVLNDIEEALRRIRDGTYGICEMTQEPIPPERLKAVPWTRFSREAEQQLEKAGAVRPTRLGTIGSVQGRVILAQAPQEQEARMESGERLEREVVPTEQIGESRGQE